MNKFILTIIVFLCVMSILAKGPKGPKGSGKGEESKKEESEDTEEEKGKGGKKGPSVTDMIAHAPDLTEEAEKAAYVSCIATCISSGTDIKNEDESRFFGLLHMQYLIENSSTTSELTDTCGCQTYFDAIPVETESTEVVATSP